MADSLNWMPRERWYHADDYAISQTFIYMKEMGVERCKSATDRGRTESSHDGKL